MAHQRGASIETQRGGRQKAALEKARENHSAPSPSGNGVESHIAVSVGCADTVQTPLSQEEDDMPKFCGVIVQIQGEGGG